MKIKLNTIYKTLSTGPGISQKVSINVNSFMTKTLNKLGIKGNFFKLTKGNYKNPQVASHLMLKD